MIEKSWGYENIIYNDEYCVKELVYTKTIASSLHYHPLKHETFYCVSGVFHVELPGEVRHLTAGQYVVIPANTPHRVRCTVPGLILESSTHDDPEDCVRLIPSET
jgi:quercetin dioxygenase-like cupin family protein